VVARLFLCALLLAGAGAARAQGACAELPLLGCDAYVTGSTVGQPNQLGGPAGEVLYRVETTDERFYGFSLAAQMNLAPGLTLYAGCALEPGAQIVATGTPYYDTLSELTVLLPANSTFTLLVEGASAEGNFDLSVWCLTCDPGPCEGATESEPNPGPQGGLFDDVSCDVPICGSLDAVAGQPDEDWFVLELTEDAAIYASLLPGGFDPLLELFSGLGGELLQSSDFSGICYSEGVETACLPAGTYTLRVAASGGLPLEGAAYQLFLGCSPCTWVDPLSNCHSFQFSGEPTQFPAAEDASNQGSFLLAEHFGHGGTITGLDVAGIQANSANLACTDPQFRVTFYADGWEPGAELGSWLVTGTPTPTGDTFFFGIPVVSWHLPLPAPHFQDSGYFAVQGAGDPDCVFGWGRSPGADGFHWVQGEVWEWSEQDLNFCLQLASPTCEAPGGLAVQMQGLDTQLSWSAVPGASQYQVWFSDSGYGPWAPLGQSAGTSYLDAGAESAGRRFYQVTSLCD